MGRGSGSCGVLLAQGLMRIIQIFEWRVYVVGEVSYLPEGYDGYRSSPAGPSPT